MAYAVVAYVVMANVVMACVAVERQSGRVCVGVGVAACAEAGACIHTATAGDTRRGSISDNFPEHADGERRGLDRIGGVASEGTQ